MIDKLNQRSNKFAIVLNDNEANILRNAANIVNKLLSDIDVSVSYIACIRHDKDVDEEQKQLKTPHYHVVIELDAICRVGTMLSWLSSRLHLNENQISVEKCNDLAMASRYLIHLDEIGDYVYHYDKFDVRTNNEARFNDFLLLVKISDLKDLICRVKEYHYDLEIIMSKISNYDRYRKYINDIIVNYYRKLRNY